MIKILRLTALLLSFICAVASAAFLPAGAWRAGTVNGTTTYFGPGYQTRNIAKQAEAAWAEAVGGAGAVAKSPVTLPTAAGNLSAVTSGLATAAAVYDVFAMIAGGPVGMAVGALVVAPAVIDWLASGNARASTKPDGSLLVEKKETGCTGSCFEYSPGQDKWYPTQGQACKSSQGQTSSSGTGVWVKNTMSSGSRPLSCLSVNEYQNCTNCSQYNSSDDVDTLISRPVAAQIDKWLPSTIEEIRAQMANTPIKPALMSALLDSGAVIPMSYAPNSGFVPVDGPSSVTGSPTVTKTNDGTNTTTTTTTPTSTPQYGSGPDPVTGQVVPTVVVTDTAKTTTVTTKNSDGTIISTVITDTKTPAPPPKDTPKPEDPATDTPLGPVPKLYTPKYAQGLEGVWSEQKEALKNLPLLKLATDLMPNVPSGGSCPTMPINLTFSTWATFGVHDVAPPCVVWDWGKAIVILSALLLARALVFGG